jgi:hypothetical protein
MQAKNRNRLVLAFVLFFPVAVFLGAFIFLSEDLPPLPPLPAQNGYEDLVKAGGMVTNNTLDTDKMDQRQLSQLVSQDATALALARSALSNPCAVPTHFSTNYIADHLNDLINLRNLGIAFANEGRLMEMESHTTDAVHSYLDIIRLGDDASRGGVLVDENIGIALYQLGAAHLQKIVSQLDSPSSSQAAKELETMDAQRQAWDNVIQQEQGWSMRTFPGFRYDLVRIFSRRTMAASFQSGERNYAVAEQKQRQLMIDLAARAYTLDKGKSPTSASDLVPDYLKAVPVDPITGANMDLSSN